MKKKLLGIFRGFPGLGRVVAGVSILEELRDLYNCEIKIISYLQGAKYLDSRGYTTDYSITTNDICSIGLLPTNAFGQYLHSTIKVFNPDAVIIDGEPLILHSVRISYPNVKIITLLNPSDVENESNDIEAMDYFNEHYRMADLAIVHGLQLINKQCGYKNLISIDTIIRQEITTITPSFSKDIYCLLGGGTVNTNEQFKKSSIDIIANCLTLANYLPDYTFHVVCSCDDIYKSISQSDMPSNVRFYDEILPPKDYYSKVAMVITRSGRNTLSELKYLGIPTIAFVSGDSYRINEQRNNIDSLKSDNIIAMSVDDSAEKLQSVAMSLINLRIVPNHCCGNDYAIKNIVNFLSYE
jgi:hypothetical protein